MCSVFAILNKIFFNETALAAVTNVLGSPTLLCIFGSRMFFNLREAGEHGVNEGTNWSSHGPNLSSIGFDKFYAKPYK